MFSYAKIQSHSFLPDLLGRGGVVLDLGANTGMFYSALLKLVSCEVHAVEPVNSLFERLPVLPGVRLHHFAVGGDNRNIQINIFHDRCASSQAQPGEAARTEIVEQIDLASFLKRLNIGKVQLMKVDIEGSEIGMLKSAEPSDLRRFEQITVEFHDFMFHEQAEDVVAVIAKMAACGFDCIRMSRDNSDVLFVRKGLIGPLRLFYLKYILRSFLGLRRMLARSLGIGSGEESISAS